MKRIVSKLFMGKNESGNHKQRHSIPFQIKNLKSIWNNESFEDAGIERIVRLLLAIAPFMFPGLYIKHFFEKYGYGAKVIAIDFFVILKTFLPFLLLISNQLYNPYWLGISIYLMLETILYIPIQIFASDHTISQSGFKRTNILVFFNYLEVVFTFAYIHYIGNYFNQELSHFMDAIYISFVFTSTIGLGDFYPISMLGKILVCFQSLFYISYIVLFINFANKKK
jgi:hypothetical protein